MVRKMFGGRTFYDALRNVYGKNKENDKNAWKMDST